MRTALALLLADLSHHREVAAATTLLVALAAGVAAFGVVVSLSVSDAVRVGSERLGADVAIVAEGTGDSLRSSLVEGTPLTSTFPDPSEEAARAAGVEAVSAQVFVASAKASCCEEGDVLIVGFEPDTDFAVTPWMGTGEVPQGDQAVAGAALRRATGLPLTLYGRRLTVSGALARTGWGYYDRAAFVPISTARSIAEESLERADVVDVTVPAEEVSVVFVRTTDPAATVRALRGRLRGVDVIELGGLAARVRAAAGRARATAAVSGALFAVVALALVSLTLLVSVTRRARDIALLRAMGVGTRGLFGLVVAQAAIIAAPSSLVGSAIGAGIALALAERYVFVVGIPFGSPGPAGLAGIVLAAAAGSTVAACAGSLAAAARAARLEPYEGLSR